MIITGFFHINGAICKDTFISRDRERKCMNDISGTTQNVIINVGLCEKWYENYIKRAVFYSSSNPK